MKDGEEKNLLITLIFPGVLNISNICYYRIVKAVLVRKKKHCITNLLMTMKLCETALNGTEQ